MKYSDPAIDSRWWSAIDVHGKFHDEHIAFSIACRFVHASAKSARLGNALLVEEFSDFADKIRPRYRSPEDYLVAQLFVGHISSFELFLQELATVVVRKYPHKIGTYQLRLNDVLEAGDLEELVFRAAEDVIRKFSYKKPSDYLHDVCEILSADRRMVEDDWKIFIEAKARRDLGVHAGWICNDTYLRKLAEGKLSTMLSVGDLATPTDYKYLQMVSDALYRIANAFYSQSREIHGV
jgi:hypothetical protein